MAQALKAFLKDIRSSTPEQVSAVLKAASSHAIPVTFRAAGTSLSGQSVSDSILLVAGKNWEGSLRWLLQLPHLRNRP
ncbi:MAG: FAD-binding oxidoreductase [Bacteroidales bacterium]|nr:FAD-binding oxidoreductase [Bacteroidales bacterium]